MKTLPGNHLSNQSFIFPFHKKKKINRELLLFLKNPQMFTIQISNPKQSPIFYLHKNNPGGLSYYEMKRKQYSYCSLMM